MPRKLPSWDSTISSPTPAVNPTTTVLEMKLATPPSRAMPSASSIAPDSNDNVSASRMYSADPGIATGESVANTSSEIEVVGPDTVCHDEPHNAATAAGTIDR